MEGSPLQIFCERADHTYADRSYMWLYENFAKKVDRVYFTNLWLAEMRFRASHQQNFLIGAEGEQASGKSLFCIDNCIRLGIAYENPFKLEKDIFANPFDLDLELRMSAPRRTYLYDEQPKKSVGVGSFSVQKSINDWEEIARYTQKNVIKCSPALMDDNPYFIFKQVDYQVSRVQNDTCANCLHYVECNKDFYSTLCEKGKVNKGIKFNERHGYPIGFNFMLFSKRLADRSFMPRGIVSLPMLHPQSALRYNEIKGKNIKNFENYLNKSWDKKLAEMKDFVEENFNTLTELKEDSKNKSFLTPKPKAIIESAFYSKFTTSRFTNGETEIFLSVIKDQLKDRCRNANEML